MARRSLTHLQQQLRVRLLRARQRFAARPGAALEVRLAPLIAGAFSALLFAGQLGDPAPEVLFPGHEIRAYARRHRHATPLEQLEHLASAHALARFERGARPGAIALDKCELRVHVPFVREERRASLGQGERAARPGEHVERGAQLTRSRVDRALGPQHVGPSGVEAPRHLGRRAVAEARYARAI